MVRRLALAALVICSSRSSGAAPDDGQMLAERPWVQPGTAPLHPEVQSVRIVRSDEPLYSRPDARSPRRGTAAQDAHLPVFQVARGPGCASRWLSVGPMAWVCEQLVELSTRRPLGSGEAEPPLPDGLPHRYYFVGEDGSLGYRDLKSAEQGYPDAELEPGFAVAVTQTARHDSGDPFGLTTHGLWLPMRDLRAARPLVFSGSPVNESTLAWVVVDEARAYAAPAGRKLEKAYPKFTRLYINEVKHHAGREWFATDDGHWVKSNDLTYRTPGALPADLHPEERWIDIELDRQVMTAFVGMTPIFTTLISSGRGRGEAENATPLGEHRIWVKLRSSDMDNLENEDAGRYYAMQSVPWVMYFKKGYGLHGAFWHRDFGHRRSHGCVNLTPLDAQRIFFWTSPRLPAGWTAVFPTRYERGTLVRVR